MSKWGKVGVIMRLINRTNGAVVAGLMLAMMLGVGLAAPSSTAAAQERDSSMRWDRARVIRFAFTLGYNRGYEDAAQGSYRTYRDAQRWREGVEGWQEPMGI